MNNQINIITGQPGCKFNGEGMVHVCCQGQPSEFAGFSNPDFEQSFANRAVNLVGVNTPESLVCEPEGMIPTEYLLYLQKLTGQKVNLLEVPYNGKPVTASLSELLVNDGVLLEVLKQQVQQAQSKPWLFPFEPSSVISKIAETLSIQVWGDYLMAQKYGTKSGGRSLAENCGIPLPAGGTFSNKEEFIEILELIKQTGSGKFIVKSDTSLGGMGHFVAEIGSETHIQDMKGFIEEYPKGHRFVVEQYIEGVKRVGTHIEIAPDGKYYLTFTWEQLIDEDGVSYMGAVPLEVPVETFKKLEKYCNAIAQKVISESKSPCSLGPDFMIALDGTIYFNEVNWRIPATGYAEQQLMNTFGQLPSGLVVAKAKLSGVQYSFRDILQALNKESGNGLLIENASQTEGVIPFNLQLPWGSIGLIVVSKSQGEAIQILKKAKASLGVL